jgi:hypothetical protein
MTRTCSREYFLLAERDRRAAVPPRDPNIDDDEEEEEDDEEDDDRNPAVIREPDEGE